MIAAARAAGDADPGLRALARKGMERHRREMKRIAAAWAKAGALRADSAPPMQERVLSAITSYTLVCRAEGRRLESAQGRVLGDGLNQPVASGDLRINRELGAAADCPTQTASRGRAGDKPADVRHERDTATGLRTLSNHAKRADQLKQEPQADRDVAGHLGERPSMMTRTRRWG